MSVVHKSTVNGTDLRIWCSDDEHGEILGYDRGIERAGLCRKTRLTLPVHAWSSERPGNNFFFLFFPTHASDPPSSPALGGNEEGARFFPAGSKGRRLPL